MKTIGIIGGIGPQATIQLEAAIHKFSPKYIKSDKNGGYPALFVYYMREAPVKVDSDGKPLLPHTPSVKLLEVARVLGKECDFLVISSNSPHRFQKEVEEASGKKVLSMIEAVANQVRQRGLKKIGIMTIGAGTTKSPYEAIFQEDEMEIEILPAEIGKKLDQSIFKVMEGREGSDERKVAEEGLEYLRAKNCQAIIMGCTEIPFLLKEVTDKTELINPIEILAEAAIKFAIE